jgi:hypothetical protein
MSALVHDMALIDFQFQELTFRYETLKIQTLCFRNYLIHLTRNVRFKLFNYIIITLI